MGSVAADLRNKNGLEREAAKRWAARLCDPYTRCSICGLPERFRRTLVAEGWDSYYLTNRFHLDRIVPGGSYTEDNIRICCALCNTTRGAAQLTDTEVLFKVTVWWENQRLTAAQLYWLNTSPGRGGLEKLGTRHEVPPSR